MRDKNENNIVKYSEKDAKVVCKLEHKMHCIEVEEVLRLGKQIGYGNLMELASALWRYDLRKQGLPEVDALIVTAKCNVRKEDLSDIEEIRAIYDGIVKEVLDKEDE